MSFIQWYPGHMHLTRQLIEERIKAIDVVIEVLDARIPGSSFNPLLQTLTGHKPRVKLLNKQDVADPAQTQAWLQWYNAQADTRAIAMDASVVSPAPVSVYAATKLAQEHLLRVWGKALGVEIVLVRLQNVYGPGQSLSNPYTGILSLFARMARSGKAIPLYEDGEVRRDFVLIDDVASAVLAAATVDADFPDAIDIGSGEFQTIRAAAELIADYYGAPAPIVTGKFREGDVRHAWADVAAAREVLGWEPRYPLSEGVRRLCDWIETQPDVQPA